MLSSITVDILSLDAKTKRSVVKLLVLNLTVKSLLRSRTLLQYRSLILIIQFVLGGPRGARRHHHSHHF